MDGAKGIEHLRLKELNPRLHQLGADTHGQQTAGEEHHERKPQIERADILVVGRLDPTHQASWMVVVVIVIVTMIVGMGRSHSFLRNSCSLSG